MVARPDHEHTHILEIAVTPQAELYESFRALHEQDGGFAVPNAWDGTSALLLKQAGFQALGTSSAALASALGRLDGRHAISREEHLANARLLGGLTGLPINGDFEDRYGENPADVAATVEVAIASGLAGIGIEDTTGDPSYPIRDFDDAVERAAKAAKGRILLTGRTDNFIQGPPDLEDTIRRLVAFAEVGADVLYAPYHPRYGCGPGDRKGGGAQAGQHCRRHDERHATACGAAKGRRETRQLGRGALHTGDGRSSESHRATCQRRSRFGVGWYLLWRGAEVDFKGANAKSRLTERQTKPLRLRSQYHFQSHITRLASASCCKV
jgi:hypothetical protein